MTAARFELVPFERTDEARRHFEAATAHYGQLPTFLLPRICDAAEFYILSPSSDAAELAAAAQSRERIKPTTVKGGFAVRVADNVKQLAAFVRSTFLQNIDTRCLVEDVLARRGDAHLANSHCDLRYIEDAVLYVLSSASDDSDVERCLRASRLTFGHSLCILCAVRAMGNHYR